MRLSGRVVGAVLLLDIVIVVVASGSCILDRFELGGETALGGSGAGISGGSGGSGGGGAGDAGGGSAGGPSGCEHVTWPDPPDAGSGPDTFDFVVAVRQIEFGEADLEPDGRSTVGYDIDQTCTCWDAGMSCPEPEWASEEQHCDGPQGQDNAMAQVLRAFSFLPTSAFGSDHFSSLADQGEMSLLVRIRQYNGLANDSQVVVSLHPSGGLAIDPCYPPDVTPVWDGTDRWPISAASLDDTGPGGAGGGLGQGGGCGGESHAAAGWDIDDAKYLTNDAYVTSWTLVAPFALAEFLFGGTTNASSVVLTDVYLTGRVEQADGGGWALHDALLVGEWLLDDFFKSVSTMFNPPLCTDSVFPLPYESVKTTVCGFADIAHGPIVSCDELSFGVRLQAEPALIGIVYVTPAQPPSCSPDTDPANDSCGNAG